MSGERIQTGLFLISPYLVFVKCVLIHNWSLGDFNIVDESAFSKGFFFFYVSSKGLKVYGVYRPGQSLIKSSTTRGFIIHSPRRITSSCVRILVISDGSTSSSLVHGNKFIWKSTYTLLIPVLVYKRFM